MKKYIHKLIIATIVIMLFGTVSKAQPGCGNTNNGLLTTTSVWQSAPFTAGSIPYWNFNAVAGNFYDFSLCAYGGDTYLRLYDNTLTLINEVDDNGPLCGGYPSSMTWLCTTSGNYTISASEFLCNAFATVGNLEYKETVRACADCAPANTSLGNIGTNVFGYSVTGNCLIGGKWSGSFNGQAGGVYHFDLCPDAAGAGTANFDVDIKITDGACNILAGEDGNCTALSWRPNDFTWTCPSNGTYYVILAPYPSYSSHSCAGTALDTFAMQYYKEPISLTCPAGAYVEGEPDCYDGYIDNFNGGCNSTPSVFSILPNNCNQVICGKSGLYNASGSRDTDWYQFTTTDSTNVYVDGIAEFDLQLGLIDGTLGCPVSSFLTSTTALMGDSAHISWVVGPGTYWIWAGPSTFVGWTCGSDYILNFYTVKNPTASPIAAANPACGSTVLSPIPSVGLDSYMWQGTSCGTSTSSPASSPYTVTSSGTYFVNAYNSGNGCWSDTCTSINVSINPLPATPTVSNSTLCTGGIDTLNATGSTGIFNWWDAPTAGVLLGTGIEYITPILTNNTTYYVSAIPNIVNDTITTVLVSNNGSQGNMFDIAVTNSITIDSLDVNIAAASTNMLVYYKTGTYLGFETNAAPWILVGTETVTGAGTDLPTRVHIGGLNLLAGQTYGIYVTTDASGSMNYTNGANTYSDANLTITTGAGGGYPFSVVNTPRTWNGNIYYSTGAPCESDRTPLTVNIIGSPAAAGTITGSAIVCNGNSGITYSVAPILDATSYVWSYSGTGATINGTGANITVDFSSSATSGNLSVLGTNSCGNGTPSLFSIVADPCTGITENLNGVNVNIMPNPTSGKCVAEIVSETAATYKLKVVDIIGQVIFESTQKLSSGTNRVEFDFSAQAAGTYYLHLTNANTTIKKMIIINK